MQNNTVVAVTLLLTSRVSEKVTTMKCMQHICALRGIFLLVAIKNGEMEKRLSLLHYRLLFVF